MKKQTHSSVSMDFFDGAAVIEKFHEKSFDVSFVFVDVVDLMQLGQQNSQDRDCFPHPNYQTEEKMIDFLLDFLVFFNEIIK